MLLIASFMIIVQKGKNENFGELISSDFSGTPEQNVR